MRKISMRKNAIPLAALGKALGRGFKWLAKGGVGDDILKGITKVFKGSGDDAAKGATESVAKKLSNIISSTDKEAASFIDNLGADILKASKTGEDLIVRTEKLAGAVDRANGNLYRSLGKINSRLNTEVPEDIAKELMTERELILQKIGDIKVLRRILSDPDNISASELQRAAQGMEGLSIEISSLIPETRGLLRELKKISGNASKNIGNDSAFIREYIKKKGGPEKEFMEWLANPINAKKAESLQSNSDSVAKIFAEGKIPLLRNLIGVTGSDVAKKAGIASAAGLAGITALTVFAEGDEKTDQQFDRIVSEQQSLTVIESNEIKSFVAEAVKKIEQMQKTMDDINEDMSNNPGEAMQKHVPELIRQHDEMNEILSQWEGMSEKVINRENFVSMGKSLARYNLIVGQTLAKIGASVGAVPENFGITTPRKIDPNELKKVQEYMNLPQTGTLDESTVIALKKVEQHLNKKTGRDIFTGLLVDVDKNHVLPVSELNTVIKKTND